MIIRKSRAEIDRIARAGDLVAETIAHYATRLEARQIVMGSHGRGALRHMLLGSVASDLIQRVELAVTLVR